MAERGRLARDPSPEPIEIGRCAALPYARVQSASTGRFQTILVFGALTFAFHAVDQILIAFCDEVSSLLQDFLHTVMIRSHAFPEFG